MLWVGSGATTGIILLSEVLNQKDHGYPIGSATLKRPCGERLSLFAYQVLKMIMGTLVNVLKDLNSKYLFSILYPAEFLQSIDTLSFVCYYWPVSCISLNRMYTSSDHYNF